MEAVQTTTPQFSGCPVENVSNGPDDRLLNQTSVLKGPLNGNISRVTLQRWVKRGDFPPPATLGGQNFWWESVVHRVLAYKAEQAVKRLKESSPK